LQQYFDFLPVKEKSDTADFGFPGQKTIHNQRKFSTLWHSRHGICKDNNEDDESKPVNHKIKKDD